MFIIEVEFDLILLLNRNYDSSLILALKEIILKVSSFPTINYFFYF